MEKKRITYQDQINTTLSDYFDINQINKTTTKKCYSSMINGF